MRTSSKQLDLELQTVNSVGSGAVNASGPEGSNIRANAAGAHSTPLKLPGLNAPANVYAATSRIAGRLNAASISDEEHQSLLSERQDLLDKLLAGTISRKENNRLEYIRWSLDRIEDAKYGSIIDALENSVIRYEHFLSEIKLLGDKLTDYASKRR